MTDFNYRTNKKRFMYIATVALLVDGVEIFHKILFDFIGNVAENDRIKFMEDKVKQEYANPSLPAPTGVVTHTQVGSNFYWKLGIWKRLLYHEFDLLSEHLQVFRHIVQDSGDTTTRVKHYEDHGDDGTEETSYIFILDADTNPVQFISKAFHDWCGSGNSTFEYDPDTTMYQDYVSDVWTQWRVVGTATHK